MQPLDLQLLRTFITIVDCHGFRRAADQLHVTQSTISQQLKRLEEITGTPLLLRDRKTVSLTPEGEALMYDARRLLDFERIVRQRLSGQSRTGVFRIGVLTELTTTRLPPIIKRFSAQYPRVQLSISVGISAQLSAMLADGQLDAAIIKRIATKGDGQRALWSEPTVWVASSDFQNPETEPLPLVLLGEGSNTRRIALAALDEAKIPWRVVATSEHLEGALTAVRAGIAITAASFNAVQGDVRVVGAREGYPELPRCEFHFIKQRDSELVGAFESLLNTMFGADA
ncbi:LysR family transcriptional regulator [Pandoraea eparura]|uniref:LysR family transcriptional regulator n=1 Tax=Pandoraea eparura TaxID=2508291 RepID=A0A5E4UAL5_9BURK|nr:LysR substrate-binding domain-containing protein [Pandoraea eparura]VVD95249.1 LysR family transcriptional regulator [Pandoraea eparura]